LSGDARDLRQKRVADYRGVRIDVVDGAGVDADGGKQPRILARQPKIGSNVTAVEEDRPPAVAALDGAVQVVPLVHPTERHRRSLGPIDVREIRAGRQQANERKGAVERATRTAARDDQIVCRAPPGATNPEALLTLNCWNLRRRHRGAYRRCAPNHDDGAGRGTIDAGDRSVVVATRRPGQLVGGTRNRRLVAKREDRRW
jgi:hypothetical protein